jgi:hypothetical protein
VLVKLSRLSSSLCIAALVCAPAVAGINSWTLTGPAGGNTIQVGTHPTQPDTLFAHAGGVFYRSTTGGTSWTYTPGSDAGAVSRVAFSPIDPNLVLMGSDRVFRSTDGGASFALAASPVPTGVREMAAAIDGRFYLIDYQGHLLQSLDQGTTWTPISAPWAASPQVSTVATDPNDAQVIWVGVTGVGLYRSDDRGTTWVAPTASPALFTGHIWSVDVQRGDSTRLLAGTTEGYAVSTNRGASWSYYSFFQSTAAVAFDPVTPANAIAIDFSGQVHRSVDGGLTWPMVLQAPFLDLSTVGRIAYSTSRPGRILIATSDGPYLSDDGGATFQARTNGVYGGYPTAFAAADDGTLYASYAAGPAGIFRRGNGGWLPVNAAALRAALLQTIRMDDVAVSRSDPDYLFALNQNYEIVRSPDGGESWTAPAAQFTTSNPNARPAVLAVDPRTPDIAWTGTYTDGLWKTVDRGATWLKRSAGLPDRIDRIGIDPANPDTVYVVGVNSPTSGIYKTTNGGATWALTGLSRTGDFWGFAFDPEDSEVLYAFGGNVLRSTDGGVSWAPLDFPAPHNQSQRVLAFMVDPLFGSTLWAVGAQGSPSVLRSVDSGASWESILAQTPLDLEFMPLDEGILDPLRPSVVHVGATLAGIIEYEVATDLSVQHMGLIDPLPADAAISPFVSVLNRGPHASSPSTLRITLPSWIGPTSPIAGCTQAAQVLSCAIPALQVGRSAGVTLPLTIAQQPSTGALALAVETHETDTVPANNTATVQLRSATHATIALEFLDTVSTIPRNDSLIFQARLSNPGPSRARDVRLELQLGSMNITEVIGLPSACTNGAGTVSCQFGTLESASSVTVRVTAQVTTLGPNVVSGTATRAGSDAEANDTATFTTVAQPLADFALQVTDSPDPVAAGATVTYTLTVSNAGPDAAPSRVTMTLAGANAGAATTSGGTCTVAGLVLNCDMNPLASGGTSTIAWSAVAGGTGAVTGTGAVLVLGVDRAGLNNNATVSTALAAGASGGGGKKGGGGSLDWLALLLLGGCAAQPRARSRRRSCSYDSSSARARSPDAASR